VILEGYFRYFKPVDDQNLEIYCVYYSILIWPEV